jgi:hypothetical protein
MTSLGWLARALERALATLGLGQVLDMHHRVPGRLQ